MPDILFYRTPKIDLLMDTAHAATRVPMNGISGQTFTLYRDDVGGQAMVVQEFAGFGVKAIMYLRICDGNMCRPGPGVLP